MPYFHKLGEPFRQPGIAGVVIPIQFSESDDPFQSILSSSLIVSGLIKDGELIIDEDELDAGIAQMEAELTMQRQPVAAKISIADRIGTVRSSDTSAKAKAPTAKKTSA